MTMTADRLTRAPARDEPQYFYFYMAMACAAVAFLGFAPTYFAPLAAGKLKANPVVHIHGIVFFAWSLFLVYQTWLGASGRTVRHKSVGLIGVAFATAMTIFGIQTGINAMKSSAAIGMTKEGLAFVIVPLAGIVFFAIVFALGVALARQREAHKRLMLLAAISILDAAIARWFLTFLAPPGAIGPPPVAVTIPPSLVATLLIVVAMIFDWRTRGRPHRVYVIGGASYVAMKVLSLPVSSSPAWQAFAGWILATAQ